MSQSNSDSPADYQAMIAEIRNRTAGRQSSDVVSVGELLSIIGKEESPVSNSSFSINTTSPTLVSNPATTHDPVETDIGKAKSPVSTGSSSIKTTSSTPASNSATTHDPIETEVEKIQTPRRNRSPSIKTTCTCHCHDKKDFDESCGYDWVEGVVCLVIGAITPLVFVALWEHEHILEMALWKNPQVKVLLQSQPTIAAIHFIKFLVRLIKVPTCLERRPKRFRFIIFCFSIFASECLAMASGASFAYIFRKKY